MWYLFNSNRQFFGTINGEPNQEDLATRDEKAVESDLILPISEVGLDDNGSVIQITTPEPTPEEIQKTLTDAMQTYMDSKVKERGYDNILSACTYANSTFPGFHGEGLACIAWRDSVWRACYDILDEVTAGQREIPTTEELIAELPKLVWPE